MAALLVGVVCGCNCQPTTSSQAKRAAASPPASPSSPEPSNPAPAEGAKTAGPAVELPEIPSADPREPFIATAVSAMLQREHLAARKIDDEVSEQAFDLYLERLDPAKLFLLQSHVDVLRPSAKELDDQLQRGDLELARLGSAIMAERRETVAKMVAELTSEPFDFQREEYFETDVDEREYAKTDQELRDLWRRNLKREVLERMREMEEASEAKAEAKKAGGDAKSKGDEGAPKPKQPGDQPQDDGSAAEELPTTDAGREAKAREKLAAAYSGRFMRMQDQTPLEATETFVNAVAAVFDPHTLYLAPDDKANFDIQMTGSLEGIGAVLKEGDHYIEVHEVVPGGAAWRQGELEAGDLIMSVAQDGEAPVDVGDMRLSEVVRMIRGPKGTVVTLSVRKPDGRLTSIVITRDIVVVEATYARGAVLDLGEGHEPAGYIYLPGFYGDTRGGDDASQRNATDDVRALLERFEKRKLDSVILDLRGNGGGLLSHATGITGLFIEQGPVVQVRAPEVEPQVLGDEDSSVAFSGKVIVLVDRFSASASEILAGALQDYERALVVGTGPTHGKGTVQMLVNLDQLARNNGGPSLGVLKLTVQQFFLVEGESTQQKGVQPDIVLPDPVAFLESGERYLENPIPWSEVSALPHEDWKTKWDVQGLLPASQGRQKKSETFAKIQARTEYLEARQEETRIPLQRSAWQQRNEDEKKALDALDPKLEEQAAYFSVQLVRYRPEKDNGDDTRGAREAAQKRIDDWREELARDPWIAESLRLLQ